MNSIRPWFAPPFNRTSRRLAPDESGVSEVLGYLLGFLMSVVILVTSLYAFNIVSETARGRAGEAQLKEVLNRVSLGIQETLQVSAARGETIGTANSSQVRFAHEISVPASIQGWTYTLSLDKNFINGTIPEIGVKANVSTFNAAVSLPPVGVCTETYVVCTLAGTNTGSKAQIIMTYQFDKGVIPIVNRIDIA